MLSYERVEDDLSSEEFERVDDEAFEAAAAVTLTTSPKADAPVVSPGSENKALASYRAPFLDATSPGASSTAGCASSSAQQASIKVVDGLVAEDEWQFDVLKESLTTSRKPARSADALAGTDQVLLWLYNPDSGMPISIRAEPEVEGMRTKNLLLPGDAFRVSTEIEGADGVLYLRLSDGRGWVFDKKPDGRTMCSRLQAPKDALRSQSQIIEATPPQQQVATHNTVGTQLCSVGAEVDGGSAWSGSSPPTMGIAAIADGHWSDFSGVVRTPRPEKGSRSVGSRRPLLGGNSNGGAKASQTPDPARKDMEYFVDNSRLHSETPGLRYCFSKNLDDTVGKYMYKAWGSTVTGVDQGDGWLQVGDLYLPTVLCDKHVLIPTMATPRSACRRLENGMVDVGEEYIVQVGGEVQDEPLLPCGVCCRYDPGQEVGGTRAHRFVTGESPSRGSRPMSRLVSRVSL